MTKTRVRAFAGTDLDLLLRAHDIDTLVVFGIATSGVVLSTALTAFDLDYRIIVVRDCGADLDAELHQCLIEKHFSRLTTVLTSEEVSARWPR